MLSLATMLGYQQTQLLDRHQSPLPHLGHASALGIDLRYQQRWTVGVNLDGTLGAMSSVPHRPNTSETSASFAASLRVLAPLTRSGGPSMKLGLAAQKRIEASEIADHTWAMALASIDLIGELDVEVGRRLVLRTAVGLPLVGLMTRHPYSLDPNLPGKSYVSAFYAEGTRPTGLGGLIAPYGRAEIGVPTSERLTWTLTSSLRYLHYEKPGRITQLAWSTNAGARVRLGGDP